MGRAELSDIAPFGQFTLIRPFVVQGSPTPNGFIVQKIDRTAEVTVHYPGGDKTIKTTKDISSFTSGNVGHAADNYYELFVVQNGKVLDSDQFQSGQILEYVPGGPDDRVKTSGTITITGTSVFIPATKAEVDDAAAKIDQAEKVSTRSQTKFAALGETWDTFKGEAANGLPFLRTPTQDLFAKSKSNTLVHKTVVTWTRDGRNSVVRDSAAGGRRRRTIRARAASRSYRKRRTGTTRRHLRGRA